MSIHGRKLYLHTKDANFTSPYTFISNLISKYNRTANNTHREARQTQRERNTHAEAAGAMHKENMQRRQRHKHTEADSLDHRTGHTHSSV